MIYSKTYLQARGSLKLLLSQKKALVQKLLREKMGLIVDVPRPGSGNSNDGNTARRFFDSPKLAANLTGNVPFCSICAVEGVFELITHRGVRDFF